VRGRGKLDITNAQGALKIHEDSDKINSLTCSSKHPARVQPRDSDEINSLTCSNKRRDRMRPSLHKPHLLPLLFTSSSVETAPPATDHARGFSTAYSFGHNPALDESVPQTLAALLCANNCVMTGVNSPVMPRVCKLKYYAPGVGSFSR
jgi:hypothetical protein